MRLAPLLLALLLAAAPALAGDRDFRVSSSLRAIYSDLLPSQTGVYDLGSTSLKWRDAHLSRNAVVGGELQVPTLASVGGTDVATLTGANVRFLGTGRFASGLYAEGLLDVTSLATLRAGLTIPSGQTATIETIAPPDADGVTIRSFAGDADMLALSNGSIDVLDVTTTASNAAVVMTWRDGSGANPMTLTVDHDVSRPFSFNHNIDAPLILATSSLISAGIIKVGSGGSGVNAYADISGKAGDSTLRVMADNTSGQYDRLSFWGPASPASGASVEMMELATAGIVFGDTSYGSHVWTWKDGADTLTLTVDDDVTYPFTFNHGVEVGGTLYASGGSITSAFKVQSRSNMVVDESGTGNEAYTSYSGTNSGIANNDRSRLQSCDDDDGTIGGTTDNAGLAFVFTPTPGNVAASVVGTWITSQQAVFTQQIRTPDDGELTLTAASAGAITVTGAYHTVDTFEDGASGELATINGGLDGATLTLQAEHTDRTVVLHDGDGNLLLSGDISLDSTGDTVTLIYSGALSKWCMLSTSNND